MINMKKTALLYTFLFFTSFFVNAQKQNDKEERSARIKSLKIAFLTEQLALTTKEAQKFWPVYNKFDDKLFQLERIEKHKLVSKIKKAGGIDAISEEEAKTIFLKIKEIDNEAFNTKIEFDKALSGILSYKKNLTLKMAEKEFIRNLMRKYRKKKLNTNE